MTLDDSDVLFRAIVVQLGEWDALAAGSNSTEQDRDRKRARIQQLMAWAEQLPDDLREGYHRVLSGMDRTWVQWEETQAFRKRVEAVRLPDLPPEPRDVAPQP